MERTLGLRTADVNRVKGDRKGASGVEISILEAASESQVQP